MPTAFWLFAPSTQRTLIFEGVGFYKERSTKPIFCIGTIEITLLIAFIEVGNFHIRSDIIGFDYAFSHNAIIIYPFKIVLIKNNYKKI